MKISENESWSSSDFNKTWEWSWSKSGYKRNNPYFSHLLIITSLGGGGGGGGGGAVLPEFSLVSHCIVYYNVQEFFKLLYFQFISKW